MNSVNFTDLMTEIPYWHAWVIAFAGLFATWLTWSSGRRYLLYRRRGGQFPLPKLPPRPEPDPFYKGSATERRAAPRRAGNEVKVFASDKTVTREPCQGWIVDRSLGGLCLAVQSAVAEKSVISVRAGDNLDIAPWVRVEVVRCQQVSNYFLLGSRFLKTPPWDIMLLFG